MLVGHCPRTARFARTLQKNRSCLSYRKSLPKVRGGLWDGSSLGKPSTCWWTETITPDGSTNGNSIVDVSGTTFASAWSEAENWTEKRNRCKSKIDVRGCVAFVLMSVRHSVVHRPKNWRTHQNRQGKQEPRTRTFCTRKIFSRVAQDRATGFALVMV